MVYLKLLLLFFCCTAFITSNAQATSNPCPVDTHGVLLDTDGDGVADCFDKEKLTKQECFPVNANGVGTCPEPDCCVHGIVDNFDCHLTYFPSLHFTNGYILSNQHKKMLDSLRLEMQNDPGCSIILKGYYALKKTNTKTITEKRLKAIVNYLTSNEGIGETRIKVVSQEGTYIDYINVLPFTNL